MNVDRKRLEQSIEELGGIGQTLAAGSLGLALTDEDSAAGLDGRPDARGRPLGQPSTRWGNLRGAAGSASFRR